MRPSLRVSHTPLIRFIGKREIPSGPHRAHPHPASPPEIASQFNTLFQRKDPSTSATTDAEARVYSEFWHAPSRYWQPARSITENEIAAVLSGGASSY